MRMSIFNGCGADGTISLRIPYELFIDVLKNCPKSRDRDELVYRLKQMKKAPTLNAYLEHEKIFENMLDKDYQVSYNI